MEVLEAAVARAVVDRKPSGTGPFAAGSEVHCFTRVANPGGQRRTLRHLWYHQGSRKGSIALQIKGRTWRTWSRLPVYSTGPWRVDVVDEDDTVLRSLEFVVE